VLATGTLEKVVIQEWQEVKKDLGLATVIWMNVLIESKDM